MRSGSNLRLDSHRGS